MINLKALVVVDMQNDFIDGALGTAEAGAIVGRVKNKIDMYVANNDRVIFTRDTHFDDYLNTQEGKNLPVKHCVKGTRGWEITDKLGFQGAATVVDKITFGSSTLPQLMGNPHEIELVGLCTDICVISNALILKAFFPETRITVDASCCAGVTPESHKIALDAMKMCQINITGE